MENQFGGSFDFARTYSSKMNNEEDSLAAGISGNPDFDNQNSSSSDTPF
jgi:hypothetical protein